MRVGLIGAGRRGRVWAEAVAACLPDRPGLAWGGVADADPESAQTLADGLATHAYASTLNLLDEVDIAVVAVPVRDRALVASEALRRGTHVFALWPPAASVVDVDALGRLAEEAGREVAVAHALPIAPLLASLPRTAPALARLELSGPFRPIPTDPSTWAGAPWPQALAGACGLLGALARSPVRRVDAQAVRDDSRRLRALAASFRFRSGFYAHLSIQQAQTPAVCLQTVGAEEDRLETTFGAEPDARVSEMGRFLDAVQAGRPPAHGPVEAARTLRLAERIMRHLA